MLQKWTRVLARNKWQVMGGWLRAYSRHRIGVLEKFGFQSWVQSCRRERERASGQVLILTSDKGMLELAEVFLGRSFQWASVAQIKEFWLNLTDKKTGSREGERHEAQWVDLDSFFLTSSINHPSGSSPLGLPYTGQSSVVHPALISQQRYQ